ncbi:hypothetical protein DEDE109153_09185 [Deinococcus deserti]
MFVIQSTRKLFLFWANQHVPAAGHARADAGIRLITVRRLFVVFAAPNSTSSYRQSDCRIPGARLFHTSFATSLHLRRLPVTA